MQKTAVKEESLPSAVDDEIDVMSGYEPKSKLGATQEKVLNGIQMLKETKETKLKNSFRFTKKSKYCRDTRIG